MVWSQLAPRQQLSGRMLLPCVPQSMGPGLLPFSYPESSTQVCRWGKLLGFRGRTNLGPWGPWKEPLSQQLQRSESVPQSGKGESCCREMEMLENTGERGREEEGKREGKERGEGASGAGEMESHLCRSLGLQEGQISMRETSGHDFGFQTFGQQRDFWVCLHKRMAWCMGAITTPKFSTLLLKIFFFSHQYLFYSVCGGSQIPNCPVTFFLVLLYSLRKIY